MLTKPEEYRLPDRVAGAVILPAECEILGLTDSKKLSEKKLGEYYSRITEEAAAVGVGIVHADVIDRINIYERDWRW